MNRHLSRLRESTKVDTVNECIPETSYAHPVDVVRELSSFILINGMADVRVGALHGDLAGLSSDGRRLRSELDIELPDGDCVSLWMATGERRTSTQSSNSTLPLASTETCLRVSRARS